MKTIVKQVVIDGCHGLVTVLSTDFVNNSGFFEQPRKVWSIVLFQRAAGGFKGVQIRLGFFFALRRAAPIQTLILGKALAQLPGDFGAAQFDAEIKSVAAVFFDL